MVEIYIHRLGDESSEDLLLADGIDVKNINNKDQEAASTGITAHTCIAASQTS
jgi:hypothetical protein